MKYKYQFKNKELEEALGVIFGEEYVENELQKQMSDSTKYIYLVIDEPESINSHIEFSKKEVERVRTYNPEEWNPYPEVDPPAGKYLVYVCSDGQKFIDVDEYTIKNDEGDWRFNDNDEVLAFRPLNVEPPDLEKLL